MFRAQKQSPRRGAQRKPNVAFRPVFEIRDAMRAAEMEGISQLDDMRQHASSAVA